MPKELFPAPAVGDKVNVITGFADLTGRIHQGEIVRVTETTVALKDWGFFRRDDGTRPARYVRSTNVRIEPVT